MLKATRIKYDGEMWRKPNRSTFLYLQQAAIFCHPPFHSIADFFLKDKRRQQHVITAPYGGLLNNNNNYRHFYSAVYLEILSRGA